MKHLTPSLQSPYTHKAGYYSHHLVEDAEDSTDGVEDPEDGGKAFVDDGEALYGSNKY